MERAGAEHQPLAPEGLAQAAHSSLEVRRHAPARGRRRHDHPHHPLRRLTEILHAEQALALLRAPLAGGQHLREPSVGRAVRGEDHDLGRALLGDEGDARADRQADAALVGRHVGAHHPGEGVAVRDGRPAMPERRRAPHELLGVAGAPQEAEVRGDAQLRERHVRRGAGRALFPPGPRAGGVGDDLGGGSLGHGSLDGRVLLVSLPATRRAQTAAGQAAAKTAPVTSA